MTKREKIVETARKYIGYPSLNYHSDLSVGYDDKGFTCSGFVHFVLTESGIEIPDNIKHAREFFDFFGVPVHEDKVKPGDLVFFTRHGEYPNHVGIVISNNEYISSPGLRKGKVKIKKIENGYKSHIDHENPKTLYPENPIGYKRVATPNGGRFQDVLE